MEEKQLDFNQPLLSVRRYQSTTAPSEAQERRRKAERSLHKLPPLPHYKSELKSGPVSNPGNVPFVWEKVPGKPKAEKELQNSAPLERHHPAAPKLPPGSTQNFDVKNQDSGKDSKFIVDIDSHRIRQARVVSGEVGKPVPKQENSEEGIVGAGDSCSEEGDEAFLDALDTFSRSDSFLNCSMISGLSGLDGPDLRPPGKSNADTVAQDFMMGRFLPAAQAMASDRPQHAARKPLAFAQEIPRPKTVFANRAKDDFPVVGQNGPKVPIKSILNSLGGESEDGDCDDYENSPAKFCGLLPRFCLLNPVPGIRNMQPSRSHSVRQVREKSSYKGSAAENRTERTLCEELNKDELESGRRWSETSCEKNGKRLEGSNLYKWLQGNGQFLRPKEFSAQAAFEAEGSISAEKKLHDSSVDGGSNPSGKRCMNFRELLASEGKGWGSGSTGPVAEKTLYVVSVRQVKSHDSTARSSASELLVNHGNLEVTNADLLNYPRRETKQSDHIDDKLIGSRVEEIKKDVNFSSEPSDESDCRAQVDVTESYTDGGELTVDAKAKNCEEASSSGNVDLESPLGKISGGQEISLVSNSNFRLPPPLPKSPSDSWLSRTLLTVSSKRSTSSETPPGRNIVISGRTIGTKSPPIETKWETIVRTSNVQHGHLRFSKELLPPVPDA